MNRHGCLTFARGARGLTALIAALVVLLAAAASAGARGPPGVCGPADCPAVGAPEQLTFGAPLASAAGEGAARRPAASRPARLRVTISNVPKGERAIVVVRGPHGRRWRIARARTFHPRVPGRWTVSGQRIVTARGTIFPKHNSTVVRVRRGGRGTVRVPYVQIVANSTRVAQSGAIRSATVSGEVHTVVISDPRSALAVGDTLAAGPAKATPQGLLITVTGVERSGGVATVTGVQAPLSAIGPQARVTVKPRLELGRGALARASAATAVGPRAQAAVQEGAVAKPYKCEGGVDATIKGSLGLSAGSEIGISWGGFWHPLTIKAIAVARLQQSSNLTLRVAGKAKCDLDVDLLKNDIRYSPLTFSVGPVPVVITPKLNFHVIAEGYVEGAVETEVRQSLDARVGLEWDGSKLIPVKTLDNRSSFTPPRPEVRAGIMGGIGPRLMFDVYSVGGPYLTAEGFVRFDVDSTRDPWWRLAGGFQAGAGIRFQVWRFSFDRNKPDLLYKDWTIAKASGSAPPMVATSTLPGATAGGAYRATLTSTGGIKPFTWTVTKGSLPAGLALNPSTGVITGTPTTPGSRTFTVTVKDSKAKTGTRELKLDVSAPAPAIAPAALPEATLGLPYRADLQGSGSTAPYRWSVAAGALPAGLSLDAASGVVSGVPTAPGRSDVTVALQGGDGQRATRAYAIEVKAGALSVATEALPGATVEAPYRATLTAAGGIAPLTWTVLAGALPDGIALSADGALTGSATAPGTAAFTVTVTDAVGTQAGRELTIRSAYPALSVGEQPLLSPMAGQPYSAQLSATGGGAPITWAVTAGDLPDGLSLASDGAISGTATSEGPSTFTVTATDKFAQTAARELTLTVVPNALEVLTATLPRATATIAYSQQLEARGGRAPYEWTRTSGSLPSGLTLAADGTVSGTPGTAGTSTFGVQVRDADGLVASGSVSLTVAGNTPQYLRGVSCPTDAFCVATDVNGGAVTWAGGRWTDRAVISPTRTDIPAVSCATEEWCLAVDTAGATMIYRDGAWSAGPAVTGGLNILKQVSCVTESFCFLAAQARGSGRAALWRWDGSAWSAPVDYEGTQMTSIQCQTATDCVATLGFAQKVMWWNGSTWSTPSGTTVSWPQQTACTPGGRCVAGGTFGNYAFYDGSAWGASRTAVSQPAYPVTCARRGSFCVFSGVGSPSTVYQWTGSGEATQGVTSASVVYAASCATASHCVVVGGNGSAHRWDGTRWIDEGVVSRG